MSHAVRFPIRLKVMISLLCGITAVVSVITFTMANFFHEDKRAYINDWISIATRSTASECGTLFARYSEQLQLASSILLAREIDDERRAELLQQIFDNIPALVDLQIYRDGVAIEAATDAADLELAGLDIERLHAYREANPLPMEQILGGEAFVRGSELSASLPMFTMAIAADPAPRDEALAIVATLRSDALRPVGRNFRVFEIGLHDRDGRPLADVGSRFAWERMRAQVHGEGMDGVEAGSATEYLDDQGVAMIGASAEVGFGGLVAAAQIPKAAANLASRDMLWRLVWLALALLFAAAIVGRFFARRLVRPVEHLSNAARRIGQGSFDVAITVESRDEIGALAGSFNQMVGELKQRDDELEVAHAQLVHSEKMAAFGQLGAGIAHEVKNPLAGILGCAQLSLMEVEPGTPLHRNLEIIEKETGRCRTIIDNLMRFARQEKALLEPTEINRVVEDVCAIVNHQLEIEQVKIVKHLDDEIPKILASANQLQQVLMNLMINAQQAMSGRPGVVEVETRKIDSGTIEVSVRDTGPGIPEEIRGKLFEPFFTTKPTGQGTGLGLSVSFGIIQDHHGKIEVESEVGTGTLFKIRLPVNAALSP